jgi:hypothetical protein
MGSIAMGSNCNGLKLQWVQLRTQKKAARIAPGGLFENPLAGFRTGQVGQR